MSKVQSRIEAIREDPQLVFQRVAAFFYKYMLSQRKNIVFESGLKLNGLPLIDIRHGANLRLGREVTLTSRNKGYHLNLHSPVKLFADRPGAEIIIGDQSRIHGTCVHAYERVEIGSRCLIAANCQIMDCSGHDLSFDDVERRIETTGNVRPVVIEDDVWLGVGVIVLPGVKIGKGAVVAASSVVTQDIPEKVIVAGNPASVISKK